MIGGLAYFNGMRQNIQKLQCTPVLPNRGTDYHTEDDGFYQPFKFTVKAVGFDGTFHFREQTIYVRFEGIGHRLMELWNSHGQTITKHLGFYPRYEYTASKD